MSDPEQLDLFVLVPGKDEAATIDAILARPHSLGLRAFKWKIERHDGRDSGCYRHAPAYMRRLLHLYRHSLVIFDREGRGAEHLTREQLELDLEARLAAGGWDERAAVVVIDPELENWIWSASPRVDDAFRGLSRRRSVVFRPSFGPRKNNNGRPSLKRSSIVQVALAEPFGLPDRGAGFNSTVWPAGFASARPPRPATASALSADAIAGH